MKTFHFHFPQPYKHEHEPVKNLNDVVREKKTPGQIAADYIAQIMGSWSFLIIQSVILGFWVILNILAFIKHWDPYPFILLNLFLSLQAAYTAPIIMMSQNRQAERDRLEAHNDYVLNEKAETEVRIILEHLEIQNKALEEIYKAIDEIKSENTKTSAN